MKPSNRRGVGETGCLRVCLPFPVMDGLWHCFIQIIRLPNTIPNQRPGRAFRHLRVWRPEPAIFDDNGLQQKFYVQIVGSRPISEKLQIKHVTTYIKFVSLSHVIPVNPLLIASGYPWLRTSPAASSADCALCPPAPVVERPRNSMLRGDLQ